MVQLKLAKDRKSNVLLELRYPPDKSARQQRACREIFFALGILTHEVVLGICVGLAGLCWFAHLPQIWWNYLALNLWVVLLDIILVVVYFAFSDLVGAIRNNRITRTFQKVTARFASEEDWSREFKRIIIGDRIRNDQRQQFE